MVSLLNLVPVAALSPDPRPALATCGAGTGTNHLPTGRSDTGRLNFSAPKTLNPTHDMRHRSTAFA